MKKISLSILFIAVVISMSGCSKYNYYVEPTPIVQGKSKYIVQNVSLNLTNNGNKNNENKTFKNEKELQKSFKKFIINELEKKSMLGSEDSYKVDIRINYKRIYTYGGNALAKPEFDYTVKVYNMSNDLLADFTIPKSTTNFGMLKEAAITIEMALMQWDAEDEPQDIEVVSKVLVRDLSELGG